eukprot:323351_1
MVLVIVYCFIFVGTCNSKKKFNHTCSDPHQFQCDNGYCIPKSDVCDGYDHCGDRSDEPISICNTTCFDFQYRCDNGQCVQNNIVCDGNKNCIDGSDEDPSVCSQYFSEYSYCSHGSIKCADDSTRCIQGEKCDLSVDCDDGSDELNCNSYKCEYVSKSLNKSVLMNLYDANLTGEEADAVINTANAIKSMGIDIQDGIIQMCLLFINIITALFIIIGLYSYQKITGFNDININYITLLIIILQMLLMTSINNIHIIWCTITIGEYASYDSYVISWLDLTLYGSCATFWYIWCKNVCIRKCSCCKYFAIGVIILVPISMEVISLFYNYNYRHINFSLFIVTDLTVYTVSQILIPVILGSLMANIPQKCDSCKRVIECRCCQKMSVVWIVIGIVCIACQVVVFLFRSGIGLFYNLCFFWGAMVWLNPCFIILNIALLFSNARYLILLYNIILLIITLIGTVNPSMCSEILNVIYIVHSFGVPMYIILIFFTIKELKQWKFDLISIYLVSFDVLTNIIVIYYFITDTHDYMFAALQILFTILGHIFGSFSNSLFGEEYNNLSKTDKILSFAGFGRPWFSVKSWIEIYDEKIYTKLATKQRIWGLMFESFPTVTLHLYAVLIAKHFSFSLISSIVVSCIAITYNVWMYVVRLTHQNQNNVKEVIELILPTKPFHIDNNYHLLEDQPQQNTRKQTFIPSWCGQVMHDTSFFIKLFLFMISDFYIRSIPLIVMMGLIPCDEDKTFCENRNIVFCLLFGFLLIFEFIMNKKK